MATEAATLYARDYAEWMAEQIAALRERRWADVDAVNLGAELEALARGQRREVKHRLSALLACLLKWEAVPQRRTADWRAAIRGQRDCLAGLLDHSPSLRRLLPGYVPRAYARARIDVADETELSLEAFPSECPLTVAEILGE
jgi:hypothetical protein